MPHETLCANVHCRFICNSWKIRNHQTGWRLTLWRDLSELPVASCESTNYLSPSLPICSIRLHRQISKNLLNLVSAKCFMQNTYVQTYIPLVYSFQSEWCWHQQLCLASRDQDVWQCWWGQAGYAQCHLCMFHWRILRATETPTLGEYDDS